MVDTTGDAERDTETFVSWREFLGSSHTASLAAVCLAVWLHAADSLIVATMLPSTVAEIGGVALLGWSVSLYEIGSIVAGAASALLIMRFGLRTPMSMAAILFGFGCILSAASPTMPLLLTGRALQGLGGGGLVAMGFVAVGLIFPRRYIARAMAAVSALWGVSAFAGPLVGGFFVEYATWRWGFAFFACQAFALALWIALRGDTGVARSTADATEFPVKRLSLLCLAVILVAFGGVEVSILRRHDGRDPQHPRLPPHCSQWSCLADRRLRGHGGRRLRNGMDIHSQANDGARRCRRRPANFRSDPHDTEARLRSWRGLCRDRGKCLGSAVH